MSKLFVLGFMFLNISTFAADEKSCYQIDTGVKYCDPFVAAKARQLWIAGTADIEYVRSVVVPHGLKPVVSDDGRALVSLSFVQYAESTVGPYNEFIVMYAVQRGDEKLGSYSPLAYTLKSGLGRNDEKNPRYGFYMQKLVLGGMDKSAVHAAIEVGKVGYGFPKISGEVEIDFDNPDSVSFSVKSHDGSVEVSGNFDKSFLGSLSILPSPTKIFVVTSDLGKPVWSKAKGLAWLATPQSAKDLKLKFDGHGDAGAFINRLEFQPRNLMFAGQYRFDLNGIH